MPNGTSIRERDAQGRHPDLFCFGCAHSAASEPFPGVPSGERPCGFCVRNPGLGEDGVDPSYEEGYEPTWYDGSRPVKVPMDCYHTSDFKAQISAWGADG